MKNLSLILNGVLLVAVAVLFYLHFAGKSHTVETGSATGTPSDLKVAFVSTDSIVKYYDYVKASREKLEAKGKKLDQDLRNRAQSFQNEYEAYQRNQGNYTIGQAKAIEEDLTKKQQNLQMYQQSVGQEISNDQAKISEVLYNKLTGFLKKYGEQNGLQFVFKLDSSSDMLYGMPVADITKAVVDGLNEEYKSEKASPTANADSTGVKKK